MKYEIEFLQQYIENLEKDIIELKEIAQQRRSTIAKNALDNAIWDLENHQKSNLEELQSLQKSID